MITNNDKNITNEYVIKILSMSTSLRHGLNFSLIHWEYSFTLRLSPSLSFCYSFHPFAFHIYTVYSLYTHLRRLVRLLILSSLRISSTSLHLTLSISCPFYFPGSQRHPKSWSELLMIYSHAWMSGLIQTVERYIFIHLILY